MDIKKEIKESLWLVLRLTTVLAFFALCGYAASYGWHRALEITESERDVLALIRCSDIIDRDHLMDKLKEP